MRLFVLLYLGPKSLVLLRNHTMALNSKGLFYSGTTYAQCVVQMFQVRIATSWYFREGQNDYNFFCTWQL